MLLDSSSLQLSHCAPCWHPKRLLLPLFLSEISLSCKKTRIACNSPSMSNFWGQGQLIWNAPFGVDGDIPTHAAGTWWLTAWVLPKQPLCGPVVPPISRDQGAACHHWQEIIALTAAADINGTAQASESFSGGQRQPGLARVVLLQKNVAISGDKYYWSNPMLTATGHGAIGMLSKPSARLMEGAPTVPAAQIASLCYVPLCSLGATAGADAGISVGALILFMLQPKLGHQCCQEAGFFGLIHGKCIFNAVSAVLYHRTPMRCITAVRALQ